MYSNHLSRKWAICNIILVAIFYLMSGLGETISSEILGGGLGGRSKYLFFYDYYKNYLMIIGISTFIVGIGLLSRLNFFRITVIILAWWNLFTAPLIDLWWSIYTGIIKGVLNMDLSILGIISKLIPLIIITVIRLYIIHILRIDRAGYIFFKNKEGIDTQFKVKWQ